MLDAGTLRGFCCLFRTHMATAEVTGQMTSPPIPLPLPRSPHSRHHYHHPLLWAELSPGLAETWSFDGLKAYGGVGMKTGNVSLWGCGWGSGVDRLPRPVQGPGFHPQPEFVAAQGQVLDKLQPVTVRLACREGLESSGPLDRYGFFHSASPGLVFFLILFCSLLCGFISAPLHPGHPLWFLVASCCKWEEKWAFYIL